MDVAATSFLESTTQKTLHAHNFNRSTSEASHVLSDLLSRYCTLLASTCARYAEHAGRTSIAVADAVRALEEMGTNVEDLREFYEGDGGDLQRYAESTLRRSEELAMLKETMSEGLTQNHEGSIQLVYAPVTSPTPESLLSDEDAEDDSDFEVETALEDSVAHTDGRVQERSSKASRRSTSPALPPSPVSRPSSPARKRARTSSWNPPSHIPAFLPPFPTEDAPPSPRLTLEAEPVILPAQTQDGLPTSAPQLATSSSTSDYLTAVPYSMSSLSSSSEHHLPERPDLSKRSLAQSTKRNLPLTDQSLVHAYHYVLTNPPPSQQTVHPLRHKVAMILLDQMYTSPRWTAAETLFANISPNRPRIVAPAPALPIPLKEVPAGGHDNPLSEKGKQRRQPLVPPPVSRPLVVVDSLLPLSTQPMSRLPEISRKILSPACYNRVTRLQPPPVQTNSASNETFLYGAGVPAPWNSNSSNSAGSAGAGGAKGKDAANGQKADGASKNDVKADTLADARLYATWDWEVKDFRMPLAAGKGRRLGSFSVGGTSGMPSNGIQHRPSISIRAGSVSAEGNPLRKNLKITSRDAKG